MASLSNKGNDPPQLEIVFHFYSGNSGLTEEFLYNNQPTAEEEKLLVLSGATVEQNLMGYVAKTARVDESKNLKVFSGPAILVVRKGKAGKMRYISANEFTANDDVYVMVPKKEFVSKVDLRWFIFQFQELFYNLVTSKSDNATFNKEYAERKRVSLPDVDTQRRISDRLRALEHMQSRLDDTRNRIERLLLNQSD